jgi:exonuclease III
MQVDRRIDYQIETPRVAPRARLGQINKARRFSDHAPLLVEHSGRPWQI